MLFHFNGVHCINALFFFRYILLYLEIQKRVVVLAASASLLEEEKLTGKKIDIIPNPSHNKKQN